MKKKIKIVRTLIKIVLTLLFVFLLMLSINQLIINFSDDGFLFVGLGVTSFGMHLFAWIAPRTFFNLCWKIADSLRPEDYFDYDAGFRKLELCDIGLLVVANIFVVLGIVII